MYLEKDIPPDELPQEFYGYTNIELEQERRIIERHMFDPLKGLIETPELTDTFFGSEMARRGPRELEKWLREEHK